MGELESDVDGDGEAGVRKTKKLQDPRMPSSHICFSEIGADIACAGGADNFFIDVLVTMPACQSRMRTSAFWATRMILATRCLYWFFGNDLRG